MIPLALAAVDMVNSTVTRIGAVITASTLYGARARSVSARVRVLAGINVIGASAAWEEVAGSIGREAVSAWASVRRFCRGCGSSLRRSYVGDGTAWREGSVLAREWHTVDPYVVGCSYYQLGGK